VFGKPSNFCVIYMNINTVFLADITTEMKESGNEYIYIAQSRGKLKRELV
jgi:hypothetical protein